jgi:hypothetical protein
MRRNSTSSLGALHPIIFFVIVYAISLFLAFFVCSTVYYTFNDDAATVDNATLAQGNLDLGAGASVTAYR